MAGQGLAVTVAAESLIILYRQPHHLADGVLLGKWGAQACSSDDGEDCHERGESYDSKKCVSV